MTMAAKLPDLTRHQMLVLMAISNGRLHGPAVVASYEKLTEGKLSITQGALYTTLQRLEDKGFLTSLLMGQKAKNPANRRRYYEVTPLGRRVLEHHAAILRKILNTPPKLR